MGQVASPPQDERRLSDRGLTESEKTSEPESIVKGTSGPSDWAIPVREGTRSGRYAVSSDFCEPAEEWETQTAMEGR